MLPRALIVSDPLSQIRNVCVPIVSVWIAADEKREMVSHVDCNLHSFQFLNTQPSRLKFHATDFVTHAAPSSFGNSPGVDSQSSIAA